MRRPIRRTLWGSATAALAVGALSVPAIGAPVTPPGYVQVPNSQYTLNTGETDLGAFPTDTVQFSLALKVPRQAAADALAKAVSDPASRRYGDFLDPSEVRARFTPSDRAAAAVTGWLRDAGMTIAYNPANHLFITAKGTVAAADIAFQTDLHRIDSGLGYTFTAPITPLYVPVAVDAVSLGALEGINRSRHLARPLNSRAGEGHDLPGSSSHARTATRAVRHAAGTSAPPSDAFVNATPCSTYWGEKTATGFPAVPSSYNQTVPYVPCGYVPSQLQGAYGVSRLVRSGITGRGVTVAITDGYNSPTVLADANTYATSHGQSAFRRGQFREITPNSTRFGYNDAVNGDICGEQGWYGEETLDVEAVHAMAPGANVLYVGGASCLDSDLVTALNTIIDGHKADIISNSWGDLGDSLDPVVRSVYHSVFVQAALEGIGVFFSSGDNGDEVDNAGVRTTDYPASDPWVTGVGGTSIGVGASNNYQFETGWGTSKSTLTAGDWAPPAPGAWVYGAGGGTSQNFAQPWYQTSVVPTSISGYFGTGTPGRSVPDIAMVGDPNTGFLVGQTQTFPDGVRYGEYRIGGTSLSSPLMAGVEALADQASGDPHGFANPAIYRLAGGNALHDVVDPASIVSVVRVDFVNGLDASSGLRTSLRTMNQTQSLATRPGYDDVTGVGSPNGARFVFGLGH